MKIEIHMRDLLEYHVRYVYSRIDLRNFSNYKPRFILLKNIFLRFMVIMTLFMVDKRIRFGLKSIKLNCFLRSYFFGNESVFFLTCLKIEWFIVRFKPNE